MRGRLLPGLIVLCFAGIAVCAEEIKLKDGTTVTGKITGVNDGVFVVKTAYGEVQIPGTDIVSISFPENHPKPAAKEGALEIDESLEGTKYVNRTGKFQLTLPEGWASFPEHRKETPGAIAALGAPPLVLMVSQLVDSGSLNTYKSVFEFSLKSSTPKYKRLKEAPITMDGCTGVQWIWTGTVNKLPMKSITVILPCGGRLLHFAFMMGEPFFDESRPVCERILASYKSLTP